MHWWKYYGLSLAIVCAIGPKILWVWLLRKRKWRTSRMTLLFLLYGASFAIFIVLLYAGMYMAALTDGI